MTSTQHRPKSDRSELEPASTPTGTSRGWGRGRVIAWAAALAFIAISLVDTGLRGLAEPGSSHFTLDKQLGVPLPPIDSPYYGTRTAIVVIVMTVFGLLGLAAAIHFARRSRSWLPIVLTLSGTLIVFPEVMVDVLGLVYYPTSASDDVYTLFGRQMGIFIFAGWFGYASLTFWIFQVLAARPRTRTLWLMIGLCGVMDVVFEEFILHMGMYVYYGRQPLVLISLLPWWWIPCNSVGVFLAATITYRLRDRLQGLRSLWTLLITPASVGTVYGAIALPSFIVTNGDYPWLVTELAGLLTIGMGIAVFAGILKFLLGREPFDPNGHSQFETTDGDTQPVAAR